MYIDADKHFSLKSYFHTILRFIENKHAFKNISKINVTPFTVTGIQRKDLHKPYF